MMKLFRTSYQFLYTSLEIHFRKSDFHLIPISYTHSSAKIRNPNSKFDVVLNEVAELNFSKPSSHGGQSPPGVDVPFGHERPTTRNESTVQISHPWQEWVDLMECLLRGGYFDADGNPFENIELGSKEANSIRTACLNFARDRFSLIRYFSRKDIQVIVGCGCPSLDRKVVNSGKRLRAHVGIDEGNVCSSCNLRGNCDRAYVKAREDEGGRTVDVMRILLTYGLDSVTCSVENKPCQNKLVKASVRRLLKEVVDYGSKDQRADMPNAAPSRADASREDHLSTEGQIKVPMKPGDWLCPKCDFLNFARNIKCLRCDGLFEERLRQLREDQDHLPLKKGDWICNRCNFLNFAKNTRCLQCKEKPPKRHLNPGEWECESCNYINFRRNMICLKCDHKRPKVSNASITSTGGLQGSISKFEGQDRKRYESSDRWRFVHEENEDEECLDSGTENLKFFDFPITRSKPTVPLETDGKCKSTLEMSEKNKNPTRIMQNDESKCSDSLRKSELLKSSDDEEMDGWFRRR
ncbi:putative diphosphoinositol polyphosphate phosphohydrolase [Hibiscus syriacus]|uniref:Diphosphoinositol polyphosphate phosphohydrolase n=3 Tax=Hibiscus syriacus TaxID=106335 RepID=A0A6A3A405_HIBSY|nr:putative diphosphoinositol polyphosphate phosphohydrolase [Hibiscus syriacus]